MWGIFDGRGWRQSLEHPDKILSRGYTRIADNLVRIIKRREDAVSRNLLHTRVSGSQFAACPLANTIAESMTGVGTKAQVPVSDKDG